ncbi:protein CHROMATIN REMODELING 35-like isoform X2 [Vigna radiata var. radiata]|uniref:Protein CHROMATIN REMODELING 35-like isoform X2 n=1 Tax=Vigna radiata var. radiata TaxID=3916 RepID=A0A3Q0EWY2_VIGRR|nr:protein CHROMATIN REMODELING 35-like isoform X2 [Vigna radiata var. radiata]
MKSSVDYVLSAKRRRSIGSSSSPDRGKRQKLSDVADHSNASAISDVVVHTEHGKYGSVTKEIEDLIAIKMQILGPYFAKYPVLVNEFMNVVTDHDKDTGLTYHNVIDLTGENIEKKVHAATVIHIDSDVEDDGDKKAIVPFHEALKVEDDIHNKSIVPFHEASEEEEDYRQNKSIAQFEEIVLPLVAPSPVVTKTVRQRTPIPNRRKSKDPKIETSTAGKGVYIGVNKEDDHQVNPADNEGLEDLWKEMSMAMECSKVVSANPLPDEEAESDEECDHSFILKDDIGYVCRVCGIIERGIETIFEFQYKVKRSTRTYAYDSRDTKAKTDVFANNVAEDDLIVTQFSAHPRHMKQMKPHQIDGFNFLVRNLGGDHPGGCILAHAPGSGKTFMIISFMQSFLGKYPNARPLVVLPKGILSTWKKEFQTWQVEDIPLYDFYTVKADSRSQQLEVLKLWEKKKSILFLGYKQFSSIVCDKGTNHISSSCQEILLRNPSILILDEGHNPRNENTDMVQSLAKVHTPRKVVLSGTLYQNHVREVFNILDLVRPKFLKMETSKAICRRIYSRVHIPGVRTFFDIVENTLKGIDFKAKVAVIQDLREMTKSVLHYYKGDFLDELPGLVDFTVVLNLSHKQKLDIEQLKKSSGKFKISSVGSAVYLHPNLKSLAEKCGENNISDDIIDALIEKSDARDGVKSKFFWNMLNLCESAGEKLLVFSQYLLPLKYLERLIIQSKGWSLGKEIFVISGESSYEQREWSMERFNNSPSAKVFFGSIKACGEGISLVGASRIVILDVHLNPSVTRQAIGRAFRPGQQKKVFVYRLVSADSPEEEDNSICFKKELISKMWFEWNEYCGDRAFEVEEVLLKECGDLFLESPLLGEDVKALYKRSVTIPPNFCI